MGLVVWSTVSVTVALNMVYASEPARVESDKRRIYDFEMLPGSILVSTSRGVFNLGAYFL